MGTLHIEASRWTDTEEANRSLFERFTAHVSETPYLKDHRYYIKAHCLGFGEDAFHWLWKLLIDEMPQSFNMLEIGVFAGQHLSLVRLLADHTGREARIVGVTLLSRFRSDVWPQHYPDWDYAAKIAALHDKFDLKHPEIFKGDSTSDATHAAISHMPPFDIVYIDGGHTYDIVVNDLTFYPQRIRPGGYLVIDDSAVYVNLPPGYCRGFESVSRAVRTIMEPDQSYKHLFACMHNRVFQRVQ